MLIAGRTNDPVVGEAALRQIETAHETAREGSDEQGSAHFSEQLTKAKAICDRFKGR